MITARHLAPVVLVSLLALTGCGAAAGGQEPLSGTPSSSPSADPTTGTPSSSSGPTASPSSSSSSAPAPEEPEGGLPPFAAVGSVDERASEGTGLGVVDVRAAHHDGFDRVVVELAGAGAPGWVVQPLDAPLAEGSGAERDVAGETFLGLVVRGVGLPQDTGVEEYTGPPELLPTDTAVVREVQAGTTFEGAWDGVVGLTGQRPFRVFALEDPPRVVLDVAHEG